MTSRRNTAIEHDLPLALTMGEPAGIGGELTLMAWLARHNSGPSFVVLDDPARLRQLAKALAWDVPIVSVASAAQAIASFSSALPVWPHPLAAAVTPGKPDVANAAAVQHSIENAVDLTSKGEAAAVVTNPIQKEILYQAGFTYPGHTEFLAHLAGIATPPVMMLACPSLRVVPITIHQSLRSAIADLSADKIVELSLITRDALQRNFGIATPRLAVAGLNPHAGEAGSMGTEEIDIIAPAIEILKNKGVEVFGPVPPDTLFSERARQGYDVAMCMYHDQALIPIKALDFEGAVNVTLGLPFIRTSPDHGTALDIAGTGRAGVASLIAALDMATDMAAHRQRSTHETPHRAQHGSASA
ncbi:MAG: 4-hydroxythreonine-4-phosphate dehydrogenase PdxA [Rhodospirillales bacterium]